MGRAVDLSDRRRRRWGPDQLGRVAAFLFIQLGKGTYLRTAPLWLFNFEDDSYSVPLGFGIGKVVESGKTVFNMFIEPQFTVLQDGAGQPEFQVFAERNMQFLPK